MKLVKIGKRCLIGVTILASGLCVAYRMGTYYDDKIQYHNTIVQEAFAEELQSALNVNELEIEIVDQEVKEDNPPPEENSNVVYESSGKLDFVPKTTQTEEPKVVDVPKSEPQVQFLNKKEEVEPKVEPQPQVVVNIPEEPKVQQPVLPGEYNSANSIEMQNLMNEYRNSLGLSSLVYDPSLQEYANIRAREIQETFGHTRPNGEYAVSNSGRYNSEIIATGGSRTSRVLSSWKLSEAHNAIMISPEYTKFAIACYIEKNDKGTQISWVTIFSR